MSFLLGRSVTCRILCRVNAAVPRFMRRMRTSVEYGWASKGRPIFKLERGSQLSRRMQEIALAMPYGNSCCEVRLPLNATICSLPTVSLNMRPAVDWGTPSSACVSFQVIEGCLAKNYRISSCLYSNYYIDHDGWN